MPDVTIDIIEGSSINEGPDGYAATRVFFVDGITGAPSEKGFKALQLKDIPKRGDPHPTVSGIFCHERNADAEGAGQVKIRCTYKSPQYQEQPPSETAQAEMSVGATITQETTNLDINNNLLKVVYTKPGETTEGVPTEPTDLPQNGEASVQIPQTIMRFARKEPRNPLDKSLQYTGTLNKGEFMGLPEGTCMCIRLEGSSSDGGKTFNVTYEFQFRPQGWRATIVYIDPDTNKVPEKVPSPLPKDDKGNGFARFDMYLKSNFDDLKLFK